MNKIVLDSEGLLCTVDNETGALTLVPEQDYVIHPGAVDRVRGWTVKNVGSGMVRIKFIDSDGNALLQYWNEKP
jgi:hypothetical protein